MKLTELDPRWLIRDGKRVGFIFLCPEDVRGMGPDRWYQSCVFEFIPRQEQWKLFNEALKDVAPVGDEDYQYTRVQGCNPMAKWSYTEGQTGQVRVAVLEPISNEPSFDNITVAPSIDGSAGGLWHGFIKNGEIVFLG